MAPRKKGDYTEIQEASRKKILMAAFELFASKGYAKTSVESIALKARISKGLIYHYFESKEAILKGLFNMLVGEMNDLYRLTDMPPKKFLQKMIDFSINYITQQTKIQRLIVALTIQPDVIRGLKQEIEAMREEWSEKLIRLFKELKCENPEAEAYLFGAIMDGISIGYITMGKEYPVQKLKKLIEKRYGL